jgi:hypothetical protein
MQAHTHLPLLLQELRRHYRVDGLTEAVLSQVELAHFLFFIFQYRGCVVLSQVVPVSGHRKRMLLKGSRRPACT